MLDREIIGASEEFATEFTGADEQSVEVKEEMTEKTEYGNKILDTPEHELPKMSELYRHALLELADSFRAIGVEDWAISGSMQKIITGVQEVHDMPGDIDIVTTTPAVEKLWELHQSGKFSFGGKATVEEPKQLSGNEKYGKSLALQLEINDPMLGSIEIEIFGEGGDPAETVNSYGGSVQLGNKNRSADICRVEGGVQILSPEDQRRQYALVLCNEIMREAGGSKEKIASRLISLLQFSEQNPEGLVHDLEVIEQEYNNLPRELRTMVTNLKSIIRSREGLDRLRRQRYGEVDQEEPLPETDVSNVLQHAKELVSVGNFDAESAKKYLGYISRVDFNQQGMDYQNLRFAYQALYDMAIHIFDADDPELREELKHSLDTIYVRNHEPRNLYILFLRNKIDLLEIHEKLSSQK